MGTSAAFCLVRGSVEMRLDEKTVECMLDPLILRPQISVHTNGPIWFAEVASQHLAQAPVSAGGVPGEFSGHGIEGCPTLPGERPSEPEMVQDGFEGVKMYMHLLHIA